MDREIWFRGVRWGILVQIFPRRGKGYAVSLTVVALCLLIGYAAMNWIPTQYLLWPWLAIAALVGWLVVAIARHTDWTPTTFLDP